MITDEPASQSADAQGHARAASMSFSVAAGTGNETFSTGTNSDFLPFLQSDASRRGFGIVVFLFAGLFEIGGGWLVWQTVRIHRPWWLALLGCLALAIYGFVATLQPMDDFGRVYAIYGAFFIVFSFVWGYAVDGMKPDAGDFIGGAIALAGALIMFLWPR
jgi:small multidrug resistance family-3 protein